MRARVLQNGFGGGSPIADSGSKVVGLPTQAVAPGRPEWDQPVAAPGAGYLRTLRPLE
jgi:hypothetical protein